MAAREDPKPVPLSVSPLWSLLRTSYESGDTEAWDDGSIPTYITSNAALAHRYSRMLLGWIRDLEAAGKLVHGEPLQILELGCGTGRFTFQMLHALEELETSPALRLLDWSYLATDLSEKRLSRLQRVAPLQRFISNRRLKIAFYDALAANPALQNSNRGPLVVIANYVFDSLPADCFRVHAGQLFETRIHSHQEDTDQELKGVSWQFSHHRIALPHYGNHDLDRILERCKARGLPKTILIPIGTVRALRNLQALTLGPRLVLLADKTFQSSANGADNAMPNIEMHGTSHFSLPIDFELLGEFIRAEGGQTLISNHGQEVIALAACMLGLGETDFPETRLAFADLVERSSITSPLYISARLREQAHIMTLHDHLALLRLVHFDPHQWSLIFPFFIRQASPPLAELRAELVEVLGKMAARWYPSESGGLDMPFLIGCAYLHIGEATKARQQLAKSLEIFGSRPAALFQMGQADFRSGEQAKGASMAREALRADPSVGGFLERLGVMPGGNLQARQLVEQMEWEASLPR